MSMMAFGLGGGGGYAAQGSDPKLADKLAVLRRTSPDDRLTAFLERDIGVDPQSVRFTVVGMREYVRSRLFDHDWDQMRFNGTSMGLVTVVSSGYDSATETANDTHADWPDLVKVFEAMVREHPDHYTFNAVWDGNSGAVAITAIPPLVIFPDPASHGPGSVLLIQRTVPQGHHLLVERQYIRIGGLLDDTTPTILDTMLPMSDLTGWSVIEELS